MTHHQAKRKITAATSALCLTETDTAPASHREVRFNRTATGKDFHHFLLNNKPFWDFVLLSNSVKMLHWTSSPGFLCFRNTVTGKCRSTASSLVSCMYFCTTYLLQAHEKNQPTPIMMSSCTKCYSVFRWMEGNEHLVLMHYCVDVQDSVHNVYWSCHFNSQEYKVKPEIWWSLPACELLWSIKEYLFYMEMESLSGSVQILCGGLISHLVWSCKAFFRAELKRLLRSCWQQSQQR